MKDYGQCIAAKRQSVPTPKRLVENGQAIFGTFDKEFESMALLQCKKPAGALFPECLKRFRLSLWEAAEIHLDNGVLLAAVCDMGLFGMTLNIFYDKRKKKVHSWRTNLKSKDTHIAPNLLNGSVTAAKTKNSNVKFINHFQDGKCLLSGSHFDKINQIAYEFELERLSLPSVVSIPFGPNQPLYSQKDFFRAKGRLIFNHEVFDANDHTTAIVDDHRGFYPYNAHYDWLTAMGSSINGEGRYLAFNLTRNQSIDQENYNENLIWFENATSLLPPVTFRHNEDGAVWTVKDAHDMVNITFEVADRFRMEAHAGIIDIRYHVVFGEIKGYIRDTGGIKYIVDGMTGIGEDKRLRL